MPLSRPSRTDCSFSAARRPVSYFAPFLRIDNALNERYQEVLGYAALRRMAAGGVKLTW